MQVSILGARPQQCWGRCQVKVVCLLGLEERPCIDGHIEELLAELLHAP